MNLATALRRPVLREPGLPLFEPGTERYRIAGGGAVVLALAPGDGIAITDREGRQRCELAVFAPDGREDAAALGLQARGPAPVINRLLAGADEAARAAGAALGRRGLPRQIERAVTLFEHDSRAGETVELRAERDVIVAIHAAGGPMDVDAQDPPTDVAVTVKRAVIVMPAVLPLPEPLADLRAEWRVDRATAMAYEVAEGEFIQIIDVAGRQCSDFLAFNARQLQRGQRGEVSTVKLNRQTARALYLILTATYTGRPNRLSDLYDDLRASFGS